MFNPLLDTPPKEYGGYAIKTDYRQPIKFVLLMQDKDLTDDEKKVISVQQFFPDAIASDFFALSEYIPWFINRGAEQRESDGEDPVFDILQDSERIYAAFLQVYKINLNTAHMHWWVFLTLLDNLPDGTKLAEVIRIRSTKIPKANKHNREQVSSLNKLKDIYALGKRQTVGEKLQSVWEMF